MRRSGGAELERPSVAGDDIFLLTHRPKSSPASRGRDPRAEVLTEQPGGERARPPSRFGAAAGPAAPRGPWLWRHTTWTARRRTATQLDPAGVAGPAGVAWPAAVVAVVAVVPA